MPPTYTNPVPPLDPSGSFAIFAMQATKQKQEHNKTNRETKRNKTINGTKQYNTKKETNQNKKTEIKEFRYHEVKRVNSNKNTPDTITPTHFTFRFRFLFHFLIHRQIN